MLNEYREQEKYEKADYYLLKGIYDYDPEADDLKNFQFDNDMKL